MKINQYFYQNFGGILPNCGKGPCTLNSSSGQNISTREKNYSEMDFEKDKSFPNFRANFYPPFSEESIL